MASKDEKMSPSAVAHYKAINDDLERLSRPVKDVKASPSVEAHEKDVAADAASVTARPAAKK